LHCDGAFSQAVHVRSEEIDMSIRTLPIVLLTGASALVSVYLPSGAAESLASPIFGVKIPAHYREWQIIAPSHEEGFGELRVILGNPIAMKAYRKDTLPFPDGTVLAKIAWERVPSTELKGAFVPGKAKTTQIMVKDSKRYAATGGWGFGRFLDGKPVDEAQHQTCFACHEANVKGHDFVFTRLGEGLR
jgi:hypothetical protein